MPQNPRHLPFSPCGRRWLSAAKSDEGCSSLTPPPPARGEGKARKLIPIRSTSSIIPASSSWEPVRTGYREGGDDLPPIGVGTRWAREGWEQAGVLRSAKRLEGCGKSRGGRDLRIVVGCDRPKARQPSVGCAGSRHTHKHRKARPARPASRSLTMAGCRMAGAASMPCGYALPSSTDRTRAASTASPTSFSSRPSSMKTASAAAVVPFGLVTCRRSSAGSSALSAARHPAP